MIITIDGPVASGKSSLARAIAQKLGYYHINSGYFYRALASILLHNCKKTIDELRVLEERDLSCLDLDGIEYRYVDTQPEVWYQETNITPFLKTREIDDASSIISTYPFIREIVNTFQHQQATSNDIVIDGRDVGTVVFPHADYKFFLTSTEDERARRWQLDQNKKGNIFSYEQSLAEVQERDRRDMTRHVAPLVVAEDATVIDNSTRSLEETVQVVLNSIKVN